MIWHWLDKQIHHPRVTPTCPAHATLQSSTHVDVAYLCETQQRSFGDAIHPQGSKGAEGCNWGNENDGGSGGHVVPSRLYTSQPGGGWDLLYVLSTSWQGQGQRSKSRSKSESKSMSKSKSKSKLRSRWRWRSRRDQTQGQGRCKRSLKNCNARFLVTESHPIEPPVRRYLNEEYGGFDVNVHNLVDLILWHVQNRPHSGIHGRIGYQNVDNTVPLRMQWWQGYRCQAGLQTPVHGLGDSWPLLRGTQGGKIHILL